MSITTDYCAVAPARADMYLFLARIFRIEVDQSYFDQLSKLDFTPEAETDDYTRGCARLQAFLADPGIDPRTDLAVDYARIFLGAGIADGAAAYPYESVYTSPEHLIMQEARDQVLALYRAKGLAIEESATDPEDHLAFELEFMAYMVRESIAAAESENSDALRASLEEQAAFLSGHLLNWVPALCKDVAKYADTDFYPAIAQMTTGFLRNDQALLEGFLQEA